MKVKIKTKKLITKIVSVVLVVATVVGLGSLVSHCVRNKVDDDGRVKVNLSYEIGGLTAYGKYKETDASIYTKKAFECDGLNIVMAFDNNISYEVFFYDENDDFMYSSGVKETYFNDKILDGVSHARIAITPKWSNDVDDDDKKINIFQISKYAKQLTVRVYEKQKEVKTYGEILDEEAMFVNAAYMGQGTYSITSEVNTFRESSNAPWYWYGPINVIPYNEVIIKVKTEDIDKLVSYNSLKMDAILLYDVLNYETSSQGSVKRFACKVLAIEDGYSFYSINIETVSKMVLTTSYAQESGLKMWLR